MEKYLVVFIVVEFPITKLAFCLSCYRGLSIPDEHMERAAIYWNDIRTSCSWLDWCKEAEDLKTRQKLLIVQILSCSVANLTSLQFVLHEQKLLPPPNTHTHCFLLLLHASPASFVWRMLFPLFFTGEIKHTFSLAGLPEQRASEA